MDPLVNILFDVDKTVLFLPYKSNRSKHCVYHYRVVFYDAISPVYYFKCMHNSLDTKWRLIYEPHPSWEGDKLVRYALFEEDQKHGICEFRYGCEDVAYVGGYIKWDDRLDLTALQRRKQEEQEKMTRVFYLCPECSKPTSSLYKNLCKTIDKYNHGNRGVSPKVVRGLRYINDVIRVVEGYLPIGYKIRQEFCNDCSYEYHWTDPATGLVTCRNFKTEYNQRMRRQCKASNNRAL